jgi:hypothetical protein
MTNDNNNHGSFTPVNIPTRLSEPNPDLGTSLDPYNHITKQGGIGIISTLQSCRQRLRQGEGLAHSFLISKWQSLDSNSGLTPSGLTPHGAPKSGTARVWDLQNTREVGGSTFITFLLEPWTWRLQDDVQTKSVLWSFLVVRAVTTYCLPTLGS